MRTEVFRTRTNKAGFEHTAPHGCDISVQVAPAADALTIAVAGRITVDSSPHFRSVLLRCLDRSGVRVIVVNLSALSYLDFSGVATFLEALKAAREKSVNLRLGGVSGQPRSLAEIAHLNTVFRAWGAEVEFR